MSDEPENQSDSTVKYKVITNPAQLGKPKKPKMKLVVLEDEETTDGLPPALYVRGLTQGAYAACQQSNRVTDENGFLQGVNLENEDTNFVATCASDPNGFPLWPDVADAREQLNSYARTSFAKLLAAANEMNSANTKSAEEKSDETQNGDSPST